MDSHNFFETSTSKDNECRNMIWKGAGFNSFSVDSLLVLTLWIWFISYTFLVCHVFHYSALQFWDVYVLDTNFRKLAVCYPKVVWWYKKFYDCYFSSNEEHCTFPWQKNSVNTSIIFSKINFSLSITVKNFLVCNEMESNIQSLILLYITSWHFLSVEESSYCLKIS